MSTSKKPLRKRKRQSPSPASTSKINRRLDKLRSGQRNLWLEDGDNDNDDEAYIQSKSTKTTTATSNKTYIVLSDSDDEKPSPRRQRSSNKSRKKTARTHDDNDTSDNDHNTSSKCITCLICSILSTLTSYNCCSKHLSLLINNKNTHHSCQKLTTTTDQWPPPQVMIVPMTDEIMQRYLNPHEINRLKAQSSSSKNPTDSTKSVRRKISKKSAKTSEVSDTEHPIINKTKSSKKSSYVEPDQSNSSPCTLDSVHQNSEANPPDATFTVITSTSTSTSTTINSFESPNPLDTCQLQSSDQPIIIDDTQPDTQQENVSSNDNHRKQQNDPWTPISNETYAAIEVALDRIDEASQEQTEFTPTTARRLPTDVMASRLPKIQLKKGRFYRGKPVVEKNTPDTTTTTDECCSSTTSQSSSVSTKTSIPITNTRPPPLLATIVEDESLIVPTTTHQTLEKSSQVCHILSQRNENTTEGLSDTLMSCLFAQDEASQLANNSITAKTISSQVPLAPPPPPVSLPASTVITGDYSCENENNKSDDISESSQLTNDQNDTQTVIPTITNEKTTITPARLSFRTNPDGSRVSISRPPLPTNHQSPLRSFRRTSSDVTSITSHSNK
ncbi:unnamed protein product [Adineta steineri]|uniref:Uncharacterized protein n=1 Tax=Adineta steineri TaxID=433720 RepID=A0A818IVL3_9BILA|nr:unnamed protein product [Adineta steineri]CAF3529528.1 unnamed protein product [Adineta steineri]